MPFNHHLGIRWRTRLGHRDQQVGNRQQGWLISTYVKRVLGEGGVCGSPPSSWLAHPPPPAQYIRMSLTSSVEGRDFAQSTAKWSPCPAGRTSPLAGGQFQARNRVQGTQGARSATLWLQGRLCLAQP